jgi:Replication initiator protein A
MDSSTNASQVPAKPLGLLGRDEMNLAEFPITLLTDRIPKEQTEAIYQDEIFDDRTGRTLARKLTIKAGGYGLTTAADDEVILALIQITRQKNNFTQRKGEFSRLELIRMLDWPTHGASYDRIELSLDKWMSVYLKYENAWRDNKTKSWTSPGSPEGFHIIDNYKLYDSRTSGEQLDLLQSYIIWNEVIFESFQAGYLKPLDYDLCMGLRNSTAKRMYRFLDKRFHHKPDWTFDLRELAQAHIGLGRNYEGPAHLKRNLQPALIELEAVGFLEPLPIDQRFVKDGKDWKIRLIQKGGITPARPDLRPSRLVALRVRDVAGRERVMRAMIVMHRQPDLLQVVQALRPPRRFPGRLDGGQQQGDQHGDDGDHHQQLDQRECTPRTK